MNPGPDWTLWRARSGPWVARLKLLLKMFCLNSSLCDTIMCSTCCCRTQKQTQQSFEEKRSRPQRTSKCHWIHKADAGGHQQVRTSLFCLRRGRHVVITWLTRVCLQEHQCAAESISQPGGERLLPAAARLCHHRVPRPPSGPDQLHLQVAAVFPQPSPPHFKEPAAFTWGDLWNLMILTSSFQNWGDPQISTGGENSATLDLNDLKTAAIFLADVCLLFVFIFLMEWTLLTFHFKWTFLTWRRLRWDQMSGGAWCSENNNNNKVVQLFFHYCRFFKSFVSAVVST